jgi:excisionase family DNA binding protein
MTQWLSVEDIAKELNVPPDTVRFWIRSKRLMAYKPGKEYRVKREDLDKFLEESRTMPDEEDKTQ